MMCSVQTSPRDGRTESALRETLHSAIQLSRSKLASRQSLHYSSHASGISKKPQKKQKWN